LLLVAAVWGASYAVVKQITLQTAILEFLAIRFGLTGLVLLPALRTLATLNWRRALVISGTLGATLFAIFLSETFGVSMTSATNAAFLISLCVIFTPFAQWWILGIKPQGAEMLAVAICLGGAGLMSSGGKELSLPSFGDALMIVAAILRALMVALTRRFAGWHHVPALTLTALQSWVVFFGICAVLAALRHGDFLVIPHGLHFWVRMAFLVLFCTVFAFFAQNYAASRMRPSQVALLMGSEPVFGAAFGMALLQESLCLSAAAGAVLIVVATTFAVKRSYG
jgi:drug/metabolite transporter (DMT)-like permease